MDTYFSDVHVLWASRFDYQKDWSLKRHAHENHYQIIYFLEGIALLQVGNTQIQVVGKRLLFLPPGMPHGILHIDSERLCSLDIKFTLHHEKLREECLAIPPVSYPQGDEIANLLQSILRQGLARRPNYQQMCSLQLGMVLLLLLRENRTKEPIATADWSTEDKVHSQLVASLVWYIEMQACTRLPSEELEKQFNHSYRYLSQQFKREVGCTPFEYANRVRIDSAKELLVSSEYAIKEIAEKLGYMDIHQFTKSFRKLVGMPPARWREKEVNLICKDINIDPHFSNQYYLEKK
ncbi:AraC family transcriptional regulator [uncultured Sphaerochaeta sp.]|uniref:AraC family transcriptional regulator n=1 Tax=uncultured Sphaerochaeta sp. TaxID=886478 RepID=UPI002A0A56D3|nr:AraC family transcriptional regulator [uncultured Sphaerochaeta sp.]